MYKYANVEDYFMIYKGSNSDDYVEHYSDAAEIMDDGA
jgi:hypothetical protein